MQAGKNRHEDICEPLELFGRRSCPSSRSATRPHVAAKAKRLEPVIEAAMARKVRTAPALPDGYSLPGHAAEDGRRLRQQARARSGSRSSPSPPPPATRASGFQINQ